MKIKVPHLCPEWDYMEIYPDTPEWEVCICETHKDCDICNSEQLWDKEE